MDKKSIKKFTVESRRTLIDDIKYKARFIGITEDRIADPLIKSEGIETYSVLGHEPYTIYNEDITKREKLVQEIKNKGFDTVVEEVAYTWFNRIIAIRFMEVNGYLPTKTRVFSSDLPGKNDPDIVTDAFDLDLDYTEHDRDKIFNLKEKNKRDELFKFLFIKQCNKLNEILPGLFEKEGDYAELLLDISFVNPDGVIHQLITSIPEEDFEDQIEIMGWFFQYYNNDRKEKVSGRRNSVVNKEYIHATTQLFSPEWLVHYLVDNSLGKYWLEQNENSLLEDKLDYYIKYQEKGEPCDPVCVNELRLFDPCMGSGQILCYAFDVFYKIYEELGYSSRQIPELILNNNLYGLDIDDRAYQLTYFNLMMKARDRDRNIFNKNVSLNIFSFHKIYTIPEETIELIAKESSSLAVKILYLKTIYENAHEFGSLIQIENLNLDKLILDFNVFLYKISNDLDNQEIVENIKRDVNNLINQTRLLTLKYDFVVTNPPYLSRVSKIFRGFIEENYEVYSKSLFSSFMYRNFMFCKENGYIAMLTPNVWMFNRSYEELRQYVFKEKDIISLVQLEDSAYYSEAYYSICAFIIENVVSNSLSTYVRLTDFEGNMNIQKQRFLDAISTDTNYTYKIDNNEFNKVPGTSMAYWANDLFFNSFINENLSNFADVKTAMSTRDDKRFLRYWFEVPYQKIQFDRDIEELPLPGFKWYPYNKGGTFRRWYGNQRHVINWENNGEEVKKYVQGSVSNESLFFKEMISWTEISSKLVSFRYYPKGFIFGGAGCSIFTHDNQEYFLGFLNSSISQEFLDILSPTIHYTVGSVSKIPIRIDYSFIDEIEHLVNENIELCRNDWDDYETSWNFKSNPLIRYKRETLSDSFEAWQEHKLEDFNHLKSNEIRLNEIFSEIYSIDVDCDVEDENISITKADYKKDIKDLISYAVGCMFGRYSLDQEGLVCAGGNFDIENYSKFIPEEDAIIPVLDTDYFGDKDIVNKFIKFVTIVFGKEHLDENLDFIAGALDKKGKTSIEKIRKYFLIDFYKDHVKKYNKCPIYWQFNSGRRKGFRCLTYLHRYNPNLVATIRINYLQETYKSIKKEIDRLDDLIKNSTYRTEITKNYNEKNKLEKHLEEVDAYDGVLSQVANKQIYLDLDDGVKVNYAKFQNINVSSDGQKTRKVNILTKV